MFKINKSTKIRVNIFNGYAEQYNIFFQQIMFKLIKIDYLTVLYSCNNNFFVICILDQIKDLLLLLKSSIQHTIISSSKRGLPRYKVVIFNVFESVEGKAVAVLWSGIGVPITDQNFKTGH